MCYCATHAPPNELSSFLIDRTRGADLSPYVLCWPTLADVNTRARRLVNAYLKQQKRDELRQVQLVKVSQSLPNVRVRADALFHIMN